MDAINIRPIGPADNRVLAQIIRRILQESGVPKEGSAFADKELDRLSDYYSMPRAAYWVIEENGTILGGGGIAPLKGDSDLVCELQKMYLVKQARGRGLGATLLKICLDQARDYKYQLCYLESMPQMMDAQKMYLKNGFKYLDGPMGNTGHCVCQVWMLKEL